MNSAKIKFRLTYLKNEFNSPIFHSIEPIFHSIEPIFHSIEPISYSI